jgi:extracellular factor (EF) 3-hydroxypalmitic acid methyl ester biosynthesis protein
MLLDRASRTTWTVTFSLKLKFARKMATQTADAKDNMVTFRTSQGLETRAGLLSLTRHAATFEIYSPDAVLKTSEVLDDFKIYVRDLPVYTGRTVVRQVVNTGTVLVCAVVLDDACFDDAAFAGQEMPLRERFQDFVHQWEKVCKVRSDFKVAIADIQTFLIDLRRWSEQVELGIRSSPKLDRAQQEREVVEQLSPQAITIIDSLFERFEDIAAQLDSDSAPLHRSYAQRHLHPIVLCAPFAYRTYRKPLGYAGDYEMVNMMLRDPQEGSSLFAKLFNVWLLHQGSAAAHRNRIKFLKERLVQETAAAARLGRRARILNLGCGPAREIQEFLAESELSNSAQFTLMDFDDETLQHAAQALRQRLQQYGRQASVELVRKSVQQLLKDTARGDGLSRGDKYDFIYCAGLFDYLPDRTCKRLMTLFYQSLLPGGLVLATNVAPFSPNRGSLELVLDWHLIYRDAAQVRSLHPEGVLPEDVTIQSDVTGINIMLETRKPNGG